MYNKKLFLFLCLEVNISGMGGAATAAAMMQQQERLRRQQDDEQRRRRQQDDDLLKQQCDQRCRLQQDTKKIREGFEKKEEKDKRPASTNLFP